MKRFILCLALFACCYLAYAQNTPAAPDAKYTENINGGRQFERSQPSVALEYYKRALAVAQTDEQKAEAQLGIGKTTPFHAQGEANPKNENAARMAAFQTALDLPGASAVQKHEARLGIGEMQNALGQSEAALAHFETVAADALSVTEQKNRAVLAAGEALMYLKRHDQARTRLTQWLEANAAPTTDVLLKARKTVAHQLIARSYLQQNNPRMALRTMKKSVAPTLKDAEAAPLYMQAGDFLLKEKQPALARTLYEMVPALADPPVNPGNDKAIVQIGVTYFEEKNYEKAREIWSKVPEMRGAAPNLIGDAWRSIGISYFEEKNYEKAREAFAKWRDVADLPTKVQVWEHIAQSYLAEKNYAGAREALTNIGKLGDGLINFQDKEILNLRQKSGIAQIYKTEGDWPQTATLYKEILAAVPVADGNPSYYYEARRQIKAAADELAKTPASMDAAYAIYEAWEKHHPAAFNKGEANMAMGDILAAQGKKEEAKAKYQRVIELRKNYDDAKIAQQKIDKLDGKVN